MIQLLLHYQVSRKSLDATVVFLLFVEKTTEILGGWIVTIFETVLHHGLTGLVVKLRRIANKSLGKNDKLAIEEHFK